MKQSGIAAEILLEVRMLDDNAYPLLFTYTDVLAGNGFVANVVVRGRSLMVQEEDGLWWIYGVNPGGFGDGGESQKEAALAFRSSYQKVLFDLAVDAQLFEDFAQGVSDFYRDDCEEFVTAWQAAVKRVREGKVSLDWLKKERSADYGFGPMIEEVSLEPTTALDQDSRPRKKKPASSLNATPNLAQAA